MTRTIKQSGLAGIALCFSVATSLAGEGTKFHFNGWTVTITARPSMSAIALPEQAASEHLESPRIQQAVADSNEHGVFIRNVSLKQEIPAPEPAPTPENVPPRLKSEAVPSPAATTPPAYDLLQATPHGLPLVVPRPTIVPFTPPVYVPQTALYRDIYFSIPFNRAEYNYYPNYRHDATMELLFNQMRPTVIQRGTTNVNQFGVNPGYGFPNGYPYTYPYQPYYPFSYGLRIHRNQ
jgi:hypothetical protein